MPDTADTGSARKFESIIERDGIGSGIIFDDGRATERLKSGADTRISMVRPWRAETRRRYALARPCYLAYHAPR